MDRPANPVSPADVLAHLRDVTKTGQAKLDLISAWIEANPQGDADALLRWAEDQIAARMLGEGTVHKMGVRIVGDTYGIRQAGETNSQEIARLREQLNQAQQALAAANRSSGSRATDVSLLNARVVALEDENKALRDQLRLLTNTSIPEPQPKLESPRPPKKTRTGLQPKGKPAPMAAAGAVSENVGALAETLS